MLDFFKRNKNVEKVFKSMNLKKTCRVSKIGYDGYYMVRMKKLVYLIQKTDKLLINQG